MNPDGPGYETRWETQLDKRQRSEVAFARMYARDFHHGTEGHLRLMLISELADLLDFIESFGPSNELVEALDARTEIES